MKKTGLNGYVYDFSVDYNAIAVADILDIHKYLMKNNGFGFIKKVVAVVMTCFSCNALKCTSINNQKCKTRP